MSSRAPPSSRRRWPLALMAAIAAAVTLLPAQALATSTARDLADSKTAGIRYIQSLQQTDGRFATAVSSPELDWALSALAAAGVAPVDSIASRGTDNGRGYYRTLLSTATWPSASPVVTDYERGSLNAYAAGIDPARVAIGRNLIASVASNWQTARPGYWGTPDLFNGTVFGLLALAGARTQGGVQRLPQVLLDKSIAIVRANQHDDGGWTYQRVAGDAGRRAAASDIDMTGATMASMCAAGVRSTDSDIVDAKNFLRTELDDTTGAFDTTFGHNTNSNGWAVQGLNVCRIASEGADFTTRSRMTPIDFLLAQQFRAGDGGWKYLTTDRASSPYASIDALRAEAGGGFTAEPPRPLTGAASQWVGDRDFSTTRGVTSDLALVIDDGGGTLNVCSVSIAPARTTTTLGDVLDAARAASTPGSCVTRITPTTGGGTITELNGTSNGGGLTWQYSIDGAGLRAATRAVTVRLGDTIYLSYA
jgi:hypothetical protein